MEDDWGPRGKPTIADAVRMLAGASDVEEACGFLQFLTHELEGNSEEGGRALLAATTERPANGVAEVIKAMDDFGHPPAEDEAQAFNGITSDMCATLGCVVLFLATRSHSASEAASVEPTKDAAVDADAFYVLEELLREYPQNMDVLDAALHVLDSLTEGATPTGHARKLKALEAGALPTVVDTLHAHRTCFQVQEYGLGALARLVGIDEAYREQLTDAGDAMSVIAPSLVCVCPRQLAFDAGAMELARSALQLHGSTSCEVACQAVTVLANLAMGPDDGAVSRKAAAQSAMLDVEAAVHAWPTSANLHTVVRHLQRNLHALFTVGPNASQTLVHPSGRTEEFVVREPQPAPGVETEVEPDALGELLERALALGVLSEAAIDKLTDDIAGGERSEQDVMLCVARLLERHPSEIPLDSDAMVHLAGCIALDARFAFALACKQFNEARVALKGPKLRTVARATLQSETLRAWALALGCPASLGFPCWAEARALKGAADLNGRVCLILAPPNEKGRCPVEFDTGWGSVEAKIMPEKGTPPMSMPPDLTAEASKSVRLANLRILDDDELQRAVRVLCRGELAYARRHGVWDMTKLHSTEGTVTATGDVGLLPMWLPKQHSAVVFMRAWELRGQDGQQRMERAFNNGALNPFSRRLCGSMTMDLVQKGMRSTKQDGGIIHEASTFMSPLMALVGKHIFIQPVDVGRRIRVDPRALTTGVLENSCIAQLMSAPQMPMPDSPVWLNDVGSVVTFMALQDLTPRDIELAWRFALKNDPGDYESHEAFLTQFTPEKYEKHVRICNARDEMMSRVHISEDGSAMTIDEDMDEDGL